MFGIQTGDCECPVVDIIAVEEHVIFRGSDNCQVAKQFCRRGKKTAAPVHAVCDELSVDGNRHAGNLAARVIAYRGERRIGRDIVAVRRVDIVPVIAVNVCLVGRGILSAVGDVVGTEIEIELLLSAKT